MNRIFTVAALVAMTLAVASPALAVDKASAVLKDKDGKEVGKVELTDTPSGVLMRLTLDGVPPGDHAFHVHAVGKCEPPDFKSAGPHFNPDDTKHGLMNAEGPHAGDMPNLHVPDSGKLTVEVLNEMVTLDAEPALLDNDGSAIVVHATPTTTRPTRPAMPETASPAAWSRSRFAKLAPHPARPGAEPPSPEGEGWSALSRRESSLPVRGGCRPWAAGGAKTDNARKATSGLIAPDGVGSL